jgi:hypothetical protein
MQSLKFEDDRQPFSIQQDEELMDNERLEVSFEFKRSDEIKTGRIEAEATEMKVSSIHGRVFETSLAAL